MAFYDDLLAVFDKYNVGLPPHLAQQLYQLKVEPTPAPVPSPAPAPTVNLPAGCVPANVPGAPGLVKLLGAFKGDHWANMAYAIREVGEAYPAGSEEQAFVFANCERATESAEMGSFYGACMPLDAQGRADGPAIAGTQAVPFRDRMGETFRTVAEAYAHFSPLDEPTTGGDFPHP